MPWKLPLPLLVGSLLAFTLLSVHAQTPPAPRPEGDSVRSSSPAAVKTPALALADTLLRPNEKKKKSPRKATLLSLALPGAGQAYNRSYWKMPIIYGGFAVLGYLMVDNNKLYRQFQDGYVRKANYPMEVISLQNYSNLSKEKLKQGSDLYRRYRDLDIILMAVLWALNVADANVDAHLKGFDMNEDLSLQLRPGCPPNPDLLPTAGVTLALTF